MIFCIRFFQPIQNSFKIAFPKLYCNIVLKHTKRVLHEDAFLGLRTSSSLMTFIAQLTLDQNQIRKNVLQFKNCLSPMDQKLIRNIIPDGLIIGENLTVQVSLFQKHLFLHQLTQIMTKDFSLNYEFSTSSMLCT